MPALIQAIYGVQAPPTPRWDLFEVFLTGIVSTEEYDVDGRPATDNPIDVDLNSQVLNADAAKFQPSEMLRLNMSITRPTGLDGGRWGQPSRLGVIGGDIQGFPNGRRLADDVVDIELLALEGIYDVNNVPADRMAAFHALKEGRQGEPERQRVQQRLPLHRRAEHGSVNQAAVGRRVSGAPGGGGFGGLDGTSDPRGHRCGGAAPPRRRAHVVRPQPPRAAARRSSRSDGSRDGSGRGARVLARAHDRQPPAGSRPDRSRPGPRRQAP